LGLGRLVPEGLRFRGRGSVETRRLHPRSNCGSGLGLGRLVPGSSGSRGGATATRRRRPEGVDLTADDADDTDKKGPEGMAPGVALSRTSDFAPPPGALCGVSLIREIREIRGPFFARSRVGHASWARRAAPQPSAFVVGSAGPQSTQKDAEPGGAGLHLGPHRLRSPKGGSLVSFLSSPWNRGASRWIGTDGLLKLWGAATPNPLRERRGLEFWGRGTGGGGLAALPPATV